jgi:hypothetical protein
VIARRAVFVLALSVLAFAARRAAAHDRSASHAFLRVTPSFVAIELSLAAPDVERIVAALPDGARDPAPALADYVTKRLLVSSDGGRCPLEPSSVRPLARVRGYFGWQWRVRCKDPARRITVESRLLAGLDSTHLDFVRLEHDGDVLEAVLSDGHETWSVDLGRPDAAPSGFSSDVRLGVSHILSGYDHLVFLLCLVVGAASLGGLARVVTGFTIGHSLTLALAVLGFVHPNAPLVEAAIALSILVVAVENVAAGEPLGVKQPFAAPAVLVLAFALLAARAFPRDRAAGLALVGLSSATACYFALLRRSRHPERMRGAVAASFGLVHGLGFAGALAERPLPVNRLVAALLGFNLGVELGQLAIAGAMFALVSLAARATRLGRPLVLRFSSAAAAGAGVFWALTRLA